MAAILIPAALARADDDETRPCRKTPNHFLVEKIPVDVLGFHANARLAKIRRKLGGEAYNNHAEADAPVVLCYTFPSSPGTWLVFEADFSGDYERVTAIELRDSAPYESKVPCAALPKDTPVPAIGGLAPGASRGDMDRILGKGSCDGDKCQLVATCMLKGGVMSLDEGIVVSMHGDKASSVRYYKIVST
jgi:hypothetical protein